MESNATMTIIYEEGRINHDDKYPDCAGVRLRKWHSNVGGYTDYLMDVFLKKNGEIIIDSETLLEMPLNCSLRTDSYFIRAAIAEYDEIVMNHQHCKHLNSLPLREGGYLG